MTIGITLPPSTIKGTYVESYVDLATPAGTLTVTFTAVPAGEVWVVQAASCWDATTDITMCKIRKQVGGTGYVLANKNPAGANDAAQIFAPVILFPGEYLDFQFAGIVVNDDTFAHAVGVKFAIDLGV